MTDATTKTFPTLHVASALTGIGLCEGLTFSILQEVYDHLGGFPIWTHEMGTGRVVDRIRDHAAPKFPEMPTHEEAETDFRAAAAKALAAYGETLEVEAGTLTRDDSPLATLQEMAGDKSIIVATKKY